MKKALICITVLMVIIPLVVLAEPLDSYVFVETAVQRLLILDADMDLTGWGAVNLENNPHVDNAYMVFTSAGNLLISKDLKIEKVTFSYSLDGSDEFVKRSFLKTVAGVSALENPGKPVGFDIRNKEAEILRDAMSIVETCIKKLEGNEIELINGETIKAYESELWIYYLRMSVDDETKKPKYLWIDVQPISSD